MNKVYVLRYTNADSYNSASAYPVKTVFTNKETAERVAANSPGYGLGIDWFVEEWNVNSE